MAEQHFQTQAAKLASLPHPAQAASLTPMATAHREPGGRHAPKFELADWMQISPHEEVFGIVARVIGEEFMSLLASEDAETSPHLEKERLIVSKLITISMQLGQVCSDSPFYIPPDEEQVEAELNNALSSGEPISHLDRRITDLY